MWPYEDAVLENGTRVVTFYSFKGGMGRTTALAAVALLLVKQGKNVMMVDTDIEAPGLATLFFNEEVITRGVNFGTIVCNARWKSRQKLSPKIGAY